MSALAACGSDDPDDATGATPDAAPVDALDVVAAFYPLQFVTEQVGGDAVAVRNLTPTGAEPHELELSARDAASLQDADLVVFLAGFAPALDDAVANVDANGFDVSVAADLRLDTDGHDTDGHGEDDDGHGHDHDGADPHFWLDPLRLADVGDSVAAELSELDPANADEFERNAAALRSQLDDLTAEVEAGLATCQSRDVVTSHEAFGYLAQRFGLHQVGIVGLSPDDEPSPAKLAEVTDFVREHGVTTIFYETLVDPAVADTVAAETGAATAVLDPLEGLDPASELDYFDVMRANLAALRAGLGCT